MNAIKRYPILFYILITYVISWGGLLLIIGGPSQLTQPTPRFDALLPLVILAILAGPSLSGLLLTILVGSKEGLQELILSLKRETDPRWYVFTIFTAPLTVSVIYIILSLFSTKFYPGIILADDRVSHLISGLMTGVAAGLFEEIGWTGFAIPMLLKKHSVLITGLIVGIIWAVWHILPGIWLGYASGTIKNTISLISYIIDPFFFLIIYRVLMVWVYRRTNSLLLAMVMHGSLTASARILTPLGIVGIQLIIFDFTWVIAMLISVYAIIRYDQKHNPFTPPRSSTSPLPG